MVLDANVIVSSVLVRLGPPARSSDAWRAGHYLLLTSPTIIAEVHATLHRPRIRRKYPVTDEDADLLAALLAHEALVVAGDVDVHASAIRDYKDAAVLACAVEGQADVIVSGDDDVLSLVEYAGIPILSVHDALELIDPQVSK